MNIPNLTLCARHAYRLDGPSGGALPTLPRESRPGGQYPAHVGHQPGRTAESCEFALPRHPAPGRQPASELAGRQARAGRRRHRTTTGVVRRKLARDRERGSGSAATVIVMGLLGLLILGMVQYAADIHGQQAAQAAASLALATAREQNGTAAAGQAAATNEFTQLTTALHDPAVDVQRSASEVTVTITGTVTTLLGITQHVTATAAGPVDKFESNTES